MTIKILRLTPEAIEQAQVQYKETTTVENAPRRDPIFTPFIMALKIDGFKMRLKPSKCLLLRYCNKCNSYDSTGCEKDGVKYWACPKCEEITLAAE